jgi:hypothetical protein
MPLTQSLQNHKEVDLISPLVSALIIVLFLFFIDEGYYDFRWMAEWGNWLVFVIYMIIFFPVQWIISHFVFRRLEGWKKVLAMVTLSVPSTLLFFWLIA